MGDVRLTSPRVRVIRDGHEPLEIQSDNRDLVLWDMTRSRHRWPKLDEAPFLWLTFVSWAAARRTGAIEPAHTYERWSDEVLSVEALDVDTTTGDEGRPFDEAPEPA